MILSFQSVWLDRITNAFSFFQERKGAQLAVEVEHLAQEEHAADAAVEAMGEAGESVSYVIIHVETDGVLQVVNVETVAEVLVIR